MANAFVIIEVLGESYLVDVEFNITEACGPISGVLDIEVTAVNGVYGITNKGWLGARLDPHTEATILDWIEEEGALDDAVSEQGETMLSDWFDSQEDFG